MSQVSTLSWSSFAALFNTQGLYQVGYAWLFGMSESAVLFYGRIGVNNISSQPSGLLS